MKNTKILYFLLITILFANTTGIAQSQDELYKKIISSYKAKNYNECIKLSKQYARYYPRNENIKIVKLILGISYLKIGKKENAIQILETHNKAYPDYKKNAQVKYLLGKLYYEEKRYADSRRILKQLINIYPSSKYVSNARKLLDSIEKKMAIISRKVGFNEVIDSYRQKDYQSSYDLSDAFITQNPGSEELPLAYYINGVSATKLQRYNDGIDSFSTIINNFPQFQKYDQVLYLRAYCYYNNNQMDNARTDIIVLKNTFPNSKYIKNADSLLEKIEKANRVVTGYSPQRKYSFTKITWAKIAAGTALIASPIFLIIANGYQNDADSIYDNKYKNATSEEEAVAYWNQVADKDKQAANFKTYSLLSLLAGIGFFAVDYFIVGRVPVIYNRNVLQTSNNYGGFSVQISNVQKSVIKASYSIMF